MPRRHSCKAWQHTEACPHLAWMVGCKRGRCPPYLCAAQVAQLQPVAVELAQRVEKQVHAAFWPQQRLLVLHNLRLRKHAPGVVGADDLAAVEQRELPLLPLHDGGGGCSGRVAAAGRRAVRCCYQARWASNLSGARLRHSCWQRGQGKEQGAGCNGSGNTLGPHLFRSPRQPQG